MRRPRIAIVSTGLLLILLGGLAAQRMIGNEVEIAPPALLRMSQPLQGGPGFALPEQLPTFSSRLWIPHEPKEDNARATIVLVWNQSCASCMELLSRIEGLQSDFSRRGLRAIGIHVPSGPLDESIETLNETLKDYGISFPIAHDEDGALVRQLHARAWPTLYLYDEHGRLVWHHVGNASEDLLLERLEPILDLTRKEAELAIEEGEKGPREVYFGLGRKERFQGNPRIKDGSGRTYAYPSELDAYHWSLAGTWTVTKEYAQSGQDGARLKYRFGEPNLSVILSNPSLKKAEANLYLDGEPVPKRYLGENVHLEDGRTFIRFSYPQQFQLVSGLEGDHEIEIEFLENGMRAHSVQFE